MTDDNSVRNKTAVITGADGNLGKAVVKKFLEENYYVTGSVMKEEQAGEVKNYETKIVDLTDEYAVEKFIEDVLGKHKKIDVAVLTAGGFAMGKIADTKLSDIHAQLKINFDTAYNLSRLAFNHMMKEGSGRIFLIGSKPGVDAKNGKGMIAYGLSKSLIFRLAELMNDEAKNTNVVVNVVVPSTIDTPTNRKSMPGADFSKWVKPETIADIIYWHCTGEASALHENVIKVYNGA